MAFGVNPATGRPGPAPKPARNDDRKQPRASPGRRTGMHHVPRGAHVRERVPARPPVDGRERAGASGWSTHMSRMPP